MKKRLLAAILVLCMVLGMLPGTALAAETASHKSRSSTYMDSGSTTLPKLSKSEIIQLLELNPLTLPDNVFDSTPSYTAPYATGKVKTEAIQAAANRLTALRRIAGLPSVTPDTALCENAQYGAVIMAANGDISHSPDKPAGMDDQFYQLGCDAARTSNLYAGRTLTQAVDGFMNDSDAGNISRVGHRRWQLNPTLGKVGFGYVYTGTGYRQYVTEKVFDSSGAGCDYEFIAWPASGYFPNSHFNNDIAWSVSVNPSKYQQPSQSNLIVTLTREADGKIWNFSGSSYTPAASGLYYNVETSGYGVSNCIIFRPDGVSAYDGVYTVEIDGLKDLNGNAASIAYQVDFFDPTTPEHVHSWSTAWTNDAVSHWHECNAEGCTITENSDKSGYGTHVYDNNADTTCNTCGYTRTITPSVETVKDKLENILENAAPSDIPADVQEKLTRQELMNALMDSDIRIVIEEMESATRITVDKWIDEALQTDFPDRQVKITGAALNNRVSDTSGIILVIDQPNNTHTLPNQFNSRTAIAFSMTLQNVMATDNLAVPVRVVLPVPDSIDLNRLAILHYENNTTYETYTNRSSNCETFIQNGNQYVALVLDHFSDFILTEELEDDDETYYIFVPKTDNGEIIPSTRHAARGDRVTLSVHPDNGYELDSLTVSDARGREISTRANGDSYSFTMPSSRVTVDAVFTEVQEPTTPDFLPADDDIYTQPFTGLGTPGISGIVLNPAPVPFTDVHFTDWFYDNVEYVWKHYLMSGVSDSQFSPHTTTSRAMIWTILARMNNIRTDINPGTTWYDRGMLWAMEQGITDGSNPMNDVTREQLAVMLWRNASSPYIPADLSRFSDSASVSGYAQSAVAWAVSTGILNGSDGKLDPQGTATRAQVAAMIARYGDKIA